jgi:peptide/nickel transport system permease protein
MIAERLEPTLSLLLLTIVLAVLIGVPLGVLAGWKKDSAIDRMAMVVAVTGFTVPVFVIGYGLAFIFASRLHWLPVQGFVSFREGAWGFVSHLLLPAATLSVAYVGLIARMTRASVLDVLGQDHVRTAKAKGMPALTVLAKHVLLNAANPIVTVVGLGVAGLIGGTVVTETVFGIPGVGRLTVDAIAHRDYPVIQGVGLFFSVALVAVNLLVDLLYRFFDPRIQL